MNNNQNANVWDIFNVLGGEKDFKVSIDMPTIILLAVFILFAVFVANLLSAWVLKA